jgi:hypothetical protein
VLGGGYPAPRPDYDDYPPMDGWSPEPGRTDAPGPHPQGFHPPEQPPGDPRGYGQEQRYEGGYEDGRFR